MHPLLTSSSQSLRAWALVDLSKVSSSRRERVSMASMAVVLSHASIVPPKHAPPKQTQSSQRQLLRQTQIQLKSSFLPLCLGWTAQTIKPCASCHSPAPPSSLSLCSSVLFFLLHELTPAVPSLPRTSQPAERLLPTRHSLLS